MPGGYGSCAFARGGVHESFRVRNRRSLTSWLPFSVSTATRVCSRLLDFGQAFQFEIDFTQFEYLCEHRATCKFTSDSAICSHSNRRTGPQHVRFETLYALSITVHGHLDSTVLSCTKQITHSCALQAACQTLLMHLYKW